MERFTGHLYRSLQHHLNIILTFIFIIIAAIESVLIYNTQYRPKGRPNSIFDITLLDFVFHTNLSNSICNVSVIVTMNLFCIGHHVLQQSAIISNSQWYSNIIYLNNIQTTINFLIPSDLSSWNLREYDNDLIFCEI